MGSLFFFPSSIRSFTSFLLPLLRLIRWFSEDLTTEQDEEEEEVETDHVPPALARRNYKKAASVGGLILFVSNSDLLSGFLHFHTRCIER